MNIKFLLIAALFGWGTLVAQPAEAGFAQVKVLQAANSWEDFYENHGMANITAGPGFAGSSLAWFASGGGRLMYGLNLDLVSVSNGAQQRLADGGYFVSEEQTALLLPFWFSMKLRVMDSPFSKVSPYIIGGMGPTLGLKLDSGTGQSNLLSDIEGEIGGGAYLGAGMDFMLLNQWAVSTDVRYNFVKFNSPLGLSDEYRGVSFSVGFLKAFGN